MLIHYGTYRFKRHVVGCRNDFCNVCEHETLTEQWCSFKVGHLSGIPLLPLGWEERWLCARCGQDPRARYVTSRGYYIAGMIAFGLITIMGWWMQPIGKDTEFVWSLRVAGIVATLGFVYGFTKNRNNVNPLLYTRRRRAVTPLSAVYCHYCGGELKYTPEAICPRCRIRVYFD